MQIARQEYNTMAPPNKPHPRKDEALQRAPLLSRPTCLFCCMFVQLIMIVYLHRLRERGWPIPKYQFAFKDGIEGKLTLREERDTVLNRHTRIARLQSPSSAIQLDVPPLLDAILVEVTAERLVLSGIERHEDIAIAKIEDFAQTWVCWFDAHA